MDPDFAQSRPIVPQARKAAEDAHEVLLANQRFYRALTQRDAVRMHRYSQELFALLASKGLTGQEQQNLVACIGQIFCTLAAHATAQSDLTFEQVLDKVSGHALLGEEAR